MERIYDCTLSRKLPRFCTFLPFEFKVGEFSVQIVEITLMNSYITSGRGNLFLQGGMFEPFWFCGSAGAYPMEFLESVAKHLGESTDLLDGKYEDIKKELNNLVIYSGISYVKGIS